MTTPDQLRELRALAADVPPVYSHLSDLTPAQFARFARMVDQDCRRYARLKAWMTRNRFAYSESLWVREAVENLAGLRIAVQRERERRAAKPKVLPPVTDEDWAR